MGSKAKTTYKAYVFHYSAKITSINIVKKKKKENESPFPILTLAGNYKKRKTVPRISSAS